MEAMTQEFMLHRRPHVEIWSAREGSDDDNDSLQRQPWTLKGSTSETKSLMDPNQQTQTNQKTRSISNQKVWWILNHTQPQIMGTQMIHLRNTPLTDPKQCQQRTRDPPQNQNLMDLNKPWSISDTTIWGKTTTRRPLPSSTSETKKSDRAQPRQTACPFGPHQKHNIWGSEQDMNQTQVFFPGSDYTSYQE